MPFPSPGDLPNLGIKLRFPALQADSLSSESPGKPILVAYFIATHKDLPCSSDDKESACNAGDLGLIPRSGRSPGEGNGNPLQYSCLENPRDGGAWWAAVYGVAPSRTRLKRLSSSSSSSSIYIIEGSLMAQMIKNLPAMQETLARSPGQEDPLEKGMAIHSSILALRIPWIEESDGLQFMGSQRVGHN